MSAVHTTMMLAQANGVVRGDTNLELVSGVLLFIVAGFFMAFSALVAGRLLRPKLPHPEKAAAYECGEPAVGKSWVQFDLRFYVVALVFIIFDVEIALFWPWAVVFGQADAATNPAVKMIALYDMLFFFGIVVVGFLFLWKFGYLDWVRAASGQKRPSRLQTRSPVGADS
jgi:NADH-quinone oxidoreductase subunit A